MQLDLKQIFQQDGLKLPIEGSFDFSSEEFQNALPFTKPVAIRGVVINQESIVMLRYSAEVEYSRECDRCLDIAVKEYSFDFEHILSATEDDDPSDEIIFVPDFRLDFDDIVLEDILLSLPMKHLCRQECKGLCPKCGCNLNHADCGCDLREPDPRLAALRELLN
ncbi:MAG: DUF177 domain-containing protein [Clostridia bacterium]|nr:DUF177 domain-containing protein [Clostridia bacterium]